MRNTQRWLIPILIVVALAIYVDLPNTPGFPFLGVEDIKTHLGLDLVGGVQTLLEADLPEDTEVSPESMRVARDIIKDRLNNLGVSESVVQLAGDRRILIELPSEENPEETLSIVTQTAFLEFVDFGNMLPQEAFSYLSSTIQTDYSQEEGEALESGQTEEGERVFHTVMTGSAFTNVGVMTDQFGNYIIVFELSPEGTQTFAEYTTENVGNILAIVVDKVVISTPQIQQPITEGQGSISGDFDAESANNLAVQLRYGSLPIPLKAVQTETIGPTLGEESLQKSLAAGSIGLGMVMLFMALYYRLPGVVADITLVIYALITFAVYRLAQVTLTMPGIAGFMLSVFIAVDANILIIERLKEELRKGRSIHQSIKLSWDRAWPSIRKSNLSTLITCLILYWFGSTLGVSMIQGFSLTLAIGVLVSLFTALTVSRTFLHLILDYIKATERPTWFGL
jgi:preprotein translocase subunit SecD